MSEHSIDVDVNFHLNDIKKIFEKIMEGSDIDFKGLSDITKLDEEGQASLLKEISSTENKTKLLESFASLGIHASIINDISKMVKDMDEDQDEQGTVIERTQSGMMTLLALSKTMMKLFDDKFPITEKMKKELDIMNDALSKQNLELDDKLDILLRSVSSIFAPLKEEQQAFKIIPSVAQPTFLEAMDKDQARASIDTMMDFVKQVTDKYTQLIERMGGGQEQFRHAGETDEIENLLNIGEDITEILEKYKKLVEEEQYKQGLVPSDPTYIGQALSTEVRDTMSTVEEIMLHLIELFNNMSTQIDTHLLNLQTDVQEVVEANEERLVELQSTIELLNTVAGDFRTIKDDLREAIETGLNMIRDDITDEFRAEIAEKLIEVAINKRLMVDPKKSEKEDKLNFLIKLVDHTFNTLLDDYKNVINTFESREALKAVGIKQSLAIPSILRTAKERYSIITGKEEGLFPSPASALPSIDTGDLKDMIDQIYTHEEQTRKYMGTMKNEMIKLVKAVENTETSAENTAKSALVLSKSFKTIQGSTQTAADHLRLAKDSIIKTNAKVNEVIGKVTEISPGDDITPLEFF